MSECVLAQRVPAKVYKILGLKPQLVKILPGSKSAQFRHDFQPPSHLCRRNFELQKFIQNLKQKCKAAMIAVICHF